MSRCQTPQDSPRVLCLCLDVSKLSIGTQGEPAHYKAGVTIFNLISVKKIKKKRKYRNELKCSIGSLRHHVAVTNNSLPVNTSTRQRLKVGGRNFKPLTSKRPDTQHQHKTALLYL